MMDKQTKGSIARMAEMLAEMAERAVVAEQQRDAAKKDADNWYRCYLDTSAQLARAEEKLDEIKKYIDDMQKGATENGKSN